MTNINNIQGNKKSGFEISLADVLAIICFITNFSYYPLFQSNTWVRYIVIGLWAGLTAYLLLSKKRINLNSTYMNYMSLYIVFIINNIIIMFALSDNVFFNHFFRPVLMSVVILFSANIIGLGITKKDLLKICNAYVSSMTICSVFLFVFYLRSVDVTSYFYEYVYGKNEIAILLMCALIMFGTVYEVKNTWHKVFRLTGVVFILVDLIILRCRTAFIGVLLLMIVIIFRRREIKRDVKLVVIFFVAACVIFFLTHQEVWSQFINNIVYAKRDSSDIDSLSSGRITQIQNGLSVFLENPLFGVGSRRTLDCLYISVLTNYGILGLPLIVMSVMPLIWGIKNIKTGDSQNISFLIIAASLFVVSIFEELAPFGPGVRCYILWLMWGLLLGRETETLGRENINESC